MRKNVLIIAFALVSQFLSAQTFSVSSSMDSTVLLVGEQTKVTFEIAQPKGMNVQAPIFADTIVSGLEIVERLPIDTQILSDEQLLVRQSYIVTSFDSALYFVDAMSFINELDTEYSAPMALKVLSIPVDTAQHAIADIKPIYAPPFDWPLFWTIVLSVLGVVALGVGGYFVYRFVKNRPQQVADENAEPQDLRPAHVIAFERLDAIKGEKLWQKNRSKEYQTQLTDVLRDYIARRFEISAPEQTSAEILESIRPELKDKKAIFADLKQILTISDLVKFAKYQPLISEDEKSLALAYQFVDATKIEAELVEEEILEAIEEQAEEEPVNL